MSLMTIPLLLALTTNSSSSSPKAAADQCSPAPSRQMADSLYAVGEWKKAGDAYLPVCACVGSKLQITCKLQAFRAYSNDPATAIQAFAGLDSLVSHMEPEESAYAEANLLHAALLLRAEKYPEALKSWKQAKQSAHSSLTPELVELCAQLRTKLPNLDEACEKIPGKPSPKATSSVAQSSTSVLSSLNPSSSSQPKLQISSSAVKVSSSSSVPASSSSVATIDAKHRWVAQLGVFSKPENAQAQAKTLEALGVKARIEERPKGDKTLWFVTTQGFASKSEAKEFARNKIAVHKLEYQILQLPK